MSSSSWMAGSSVVPPDSAEVSMTAQALLQAHRERIAQPGANDAAGPLQDVERSIVKLDKVLSQLQSGSELGQQTRPPRKNQSGTVLQPMGSVAFWPAKIVNADQVYVRQLPSGLSLADELALEQTPLARSPAGTGQTEMAVQAHLLNPSRTLDVKYIKMHVRDAQSQLETRRRKLQLAAHALRLGSSDVQSTLSHSTPDIEPPPPHTVNEQSEALNEEGLPFFEPIERLPDLAQGETPTPTAPAYMQPFVRTNTKLATDKKERQKWMDDVFSKLEQEEDEGTGPAPLESGSGAKAAAEPLPAEQEFRVVLRTRTPSPPPEAESDTSATLLPAIVSAARPPPPKSALKNNVATRPPVLQRPSFGSTGIRRGFLNLNPSSPGALQSSYTQEELEKDMRQAQETNEERPSRSHTPIAKAISSIPPLSAIKTDDVSSSPVTSGTSTPTRKSVRIKSPERAHPDASSHTGLTPLQRALKSSIRVKEKDLTPQPQAQTQSPSTPLASTQRADSGSGTVEKRHKDDIGVEQEAERIVNLLGPAVVEGHPSAPPSDLLRKMQEAHEQDQQLSTPEAIAERAKLEEEQRRAEHARRLQEKPALGQAVMERQASAPKATSDKNAKAPSAFKRGFLNQKPPKFVPNKPVRAPLSFSSKGSEALPNAPTESLGMSALDRASLGDDELEKRRVQMGLPAAVPHARPSKAYAEKIQHKQAGLEQDSVSSNANESSDVDGGRQTLARPKADDDVPRPGRVRFGAPSSSHDNGADEDDEEPVIDSSVKLDNHREEQDVEVDEEQEEPKITGEGADADDDVDEDDDYFDSYLNDRAQQFADDDGEQDEDDLDWDISTDDEIDQDDFDYDPEDLLALAPDMDADTLGFSGNDELVREYAEAKARLQALGLALPGDSAAASSTSAANVDQIDDDEDDYIDDIVPLDATVDDPEYQGNTASANAGGGTSRISRFKASLGSQRPSTRTPSSAQELTTMFQSARNLGQNTTASTSDASWKGMDGATASTEDAAPGTPLMVIPQLAPVRYPKNGQVLARDAGKPVDLDGESSDDDDVKAELNMRSRLDRLEWKQNNPEQAQRLAETKKLQRQLDQGIAPPQIAHRQPAQQESRAQSSNAEPKAAVPPEEDSQPPKPKKVSRFKASRMT